MAAATTQTSFDYVDSTLGQLTDGTGKPVRLRDRRRASWHRSNWPGVHGGRDNTADTGHSIARPSFLDMAVRELMRTGNAVFYLMRGQRNGDFTLLPMPGFKVSGGLLPSQWRYELKALDQDENELTFNAASDDVIHFRYGATALAPWYGQSPLVAAGADARVLANIVNKVGDDASTPVAHMIPMPDGATVAQRQGVAKDIRDARGRVIVPETTRAGIGQGAAAAPQRDLESSRVGPDPSANALALKETSGLEMLRALGIMPGLYSLSGGASREGYRQFYAVTAAALARLMEEELRKKLNLPELAISLDDLAAIDITAKSRAVGTLVKAGVPLPLAVQMAGFKNVVVPDVPEFPTP